MPCGVAGEKKKSGYVMQSPYLAKCLAGTWCWLLLLTPFTSWGTEAQERLTKVLSNYRAGGENLLGVMEEFCILIWVHRCIMCQNVLSCTPKICALHCM